MNLKTCNKHVSLQMKAARVTLYDGDIEILDESSGVGEDEVIE